MPRSKYVASEQGVVPSGVDYTDRRAGMWYLGVSLGRDTDKFRGEKLGAIVAWIGTRATSCLVLVGDGIHRLNLQMECGLGEEESDVSACQYGADFVHDSRQLLLAESRCRFDIAFCSEVQKTNGYTRWYTELSSAYRDNADFRSSLDEDAQGWIERRRRAGRLDVSTAAANALSARYLLEELAIFSCLAETGFRVMVYPGKELETTRRIRYGELNSPAFEWMNHRTTVCLRVTSR